MGPPVLLHFSLFIFHFAFHFQTMPTAIANCYYVFYESRASNLESRLKPEVE